MILKKCKKIKYIKKISTKEITEIIGEKYDIKQCENEINLESSNIEKNEKEIKPSNTLVKFFSKIRKIIKI